MAFIVVYDANVLYPNALRDLLIRISQAGLVQARWTNEILDEMLRALARNRADIPPDKLDRLRQLMNGAVRDCLVCGYESLVAGLKLPDPADRHVLAAAIKAGAQVIVTANLKHWVRVSFVGDWPVTCRWQCPGLRGPGQVVPVWLRGRCQIWLSGMLACSQRRAVMASAPRMVQCCPASLSRWPMTALHPDSTTPEPANRPRERNHL